MMTQLQDSVRFETLYNPDTKEWELVKTSTLHVGSYTEDIAASLAAFWNDVYFEPSAFHYTRVFIKQKFVGDLALLPDSDKRAWFIDRRVQDAVGMPFDPSGFPYEHAAQKAILNAWKAKCAANGKAWPK